MFDNSDIANAHSFTALNNATVNPGEQFGSYATIPDNTAAAFTPFTFVPATIPVSPLWQLTYNGVTYSFDATSMNPVYDSGIWNFDGTGIAHVTGFDDTAGTWSMHAFGIGESYSFSFASAVPEPSASALMLVALAGALGLRWRSRPRPDR